MSCGCCTPTPTSCPVTVCASGCAGALPGASASIVQDGTAVSSGPVSMSDGCAVLSIPAAGTYTVVASAPNYQDASETIDLHCGQRVPVALVPVAATFPVTIWAVSACCAKDVYADGPLPYACQQWGFPLPGATVAITGGPTATTGADGSATFDLAPGTYAFTISKGRFDDATGMIGVGACGMTQTDAPCYVLQPADGYFCGPSFDPDGTPRPDPLPATLQVTDRYGSYTITNPGGGAPWTGSGTGTASGCDCPGLGFTRTTTLNGCLASQYGPVATTSWPYSQNIAGCGGVCDPPHWSAPCPDDDAPTCSLPNTCSEHASTTLPWYFESGLSQPYTIAPGVPFQFTGGVDWAASCINPGPVAYPPGSTITIAELPSTPPPPTIESPTSPAAPPSFMAQAKSAVRAAARVTVAAATGAPVRLSEEAIERRVAVCRGCPFHLAAEGRCGKCGCYLRYKAALATETCPDGRWPAVP